MIQKFIDRIRTMDDDTFNRFIDYVVNQINHKNNLKSVDVDEFIKELRQIRKNTQNIVVDKDLDDYKITYSNDNNPIKCELPAFIIGYFLIGIIITIMMVFLLLISQPSLAAPPCLQ
jgi:hypothetical protein